MNVYHIGYHKTGNTWINNVLLPMVRPVLDARGVRVRCDESLSGSLFEDDVTHPKVLASRDPNARVVICIRNQTTMFPSLYWLYVKSGGNLRFEHYVTSAIKNGKLRYDILVAAYVDVLGPDNVLVLAYEQLRTDPAGFLAEVACFWGLPPDGLPIRAVGQRANPSPSHGFVEVTRRANALLHPNTKAAFMLRRLPQFLWLALEKPFAMNGRRGLYHRDDRTVMAGIEKEYAAPNRTLTGTVPIDLSGHGYPGVP